MSRKYDAIVGLILNVHVNQISHKHRLINDYVNKYPRTDIVVRVLSLQEFLDESSESKDPRSLGPGSRTQFRCGSCCDSHLSWEIIFAKYQLV